MIISTILNAEHQESSILEPDISIPFPQCFTTESAPSFLNPKVIEHIFDMKLEEEDRKLTQERNRNLNLNNGMFKM